MESSQSARRKESNVKFLELLPHVCVVEGFINYHRQPNMRQCVSCGLKLNDEIAARVLKEDGDCPECGGNMKRWKGRSFGDAHVTVCLDERMHWPEMIKLPEGDPERNSHLLKRELTKADFDAWVDTLDDRQKVGREENPPFHTASFEIEEAEMELHNSQPKKFDEIVSRKLRERLELDFQHSIQERGTFSRKPLSAYLSP